MKAGAELWPRAHALSLYDWAGAGGERRNYLPDSLFCFTLLFLLSSFRSFVQWIYKSVFVVHT